MPSSRVRSSTGRPCHAKSSRTGKPCKNWPIPGGAVCKFHGGAAPHVKAAANQRLRDFVADLIDPDKMLREAGYIARFDPRSLFNKDGNVLPVDQWPDGSAAAVAGFEVVKRNVYVGDDKVDDVIKVRIADKLKALEMLFKHHGLMTEKVELSVGAGVLERLAAGRERVARARHGK